MNQLKEAAHAGAYRVLEDPPEYAIIDLVQDMLERNDATGQKISRPSPNSAIGQAIVVSYLAAEKHMNDNAPDLNEGDTGFNEHFEAAIEVGAAAGIRYLTGR